MLSVDVNGELSWRRDDLSVDFHPFEDRSLRSWRRVSVPGLMGEPTNLHPLGVVRTLYEQPRILGAGHMFGYNPPPTYAVGVWSRRPDIPSPRWCQVWDREARATTLAFLACACRFPRDVRRLIARHIWAGRAAGPGVWGNGFL